MKRLEKGVRREILDALDRLIAELIADASVLTNVKKMKGGATEWRVRIGDFRILFVKDERELENGVVEGLVIVTEIGNRRDVYRGK